jgi:ribosomal protein S6--L-glutamate ligase
LALALLKEAEARGARSVNAWAGVIKLRNKVRATLALARRRIPVPTTYVAHVPENLRGVPRAHFPLILKPFQGDNAAGILVVADPGELRSVMWPDPLVLAQPYVETDGIDLKLYVAADRVWAIRRRSPISEGTAVATPVQVTPELERLARACGLTFGLNLVGIDVLETADGPLVVDVNDFPNYTGIDDAPEVVGWFVLDRAGLADPEHPSGHGLAGRPEGRQ